MNRSVAPLALVIAVLAFLFAGIGLVTPTAPKQPSLAPYLTKLAVGAGSSGAMEAAQDRIRANVTSQGFVVAGLKVAYVRIVGNLATVVVDVSYEAPVKGAHVVTVPATVVMHRTVWSAGQISLGDNRPKS